ncbi:uncharacterized protein [Centruroides vittatus]|uniref:uncharacterized protein n=1 Tax=Centruroides vittatus TaxID=120091 RepID=UPI00350FEFF8
MFTLPFSNFAMTKVCAALSCNNTTNDTKLTWHNLPKEEWLRELWVDLLGIKDNKSCENKVCSSHFKQKDFTNGRKTLLKGGSVPELHLAKPMNMDDTESESDVILLSSSDDDRKVNRKSLKRLHERRKKLYDDSSDSEDEVDSNLKKRCRKAARMAVAKISKTVQKYQLAEPNSYKEKKDNSIVFTQFDTANVTKKKEPLIIIKPENNIDLMMECYEELLTQTQVDAYRRARQEYDSVLKRLYNLKVTNAKITYCTDLSLLPPEDANMKSNFLSEDFNISDKSIHDTLVQKTVSPPVNNSVAVPKLPVVTEAVLLTSLTTPITQMTTLPSKTVTSNSALTSGKRIENNNLIPAGSTPTSTNVTSVLPVFSQSKMNTVNHMPVMIGQPQTPIQLLQTTSQPPTIFLANAPSTTTTTKSSIPPLLLSGKLINSNSCKIVVDSKTGTVLGTMTVDPLSGNSVCRVPESAVSGKTIQVLKVSNVATQPVIPVPAVPVKLVTSLPQQQTNASVANENSENIGELTADDTLISFKDIPEVKGGSKDFSMHTILSLRPKTINVSDDLLNIEKQIVANKLFENGFLDTPIHWLLKMRIFPSQPLCRICAMGFMQLTPDATALDGYKWLCRNPRCSRLSPVRRLLFFDRFGIPLGKLFALTYHWAVQSSIDLVLKEVSMDIYRLRTVWRAIQEVCARAVALKADKLGGEDNKVEVGAVRIGRLIVLGALDRKTRATRLKAFPSGVGWKSAILVKTLEPWLLQGTHIISNISCLKCLNNKGYRHSFSNKCINQSSAQNVDNVSDVIKYLMTKLTDAFGLYAVDQLRLINLQGYLDELQWRERFGKTLNLSFWNIFEHIIEQSGHKFQFRENANVGQQFQPDQTKTDKISNPKPNKTATTKNGTREKKKRPRKILKMSSDSEDFSSDREEATANNNKIIRDSPEYKDDSENNSVKIYQEDIVALEEFYYARKNSSKKLLKAEYKGNFQFKCLICKKIVENNIKVMKHINAHIDNRRQCKPNLSDLTQCKYCFRDFDTPFSMQCHIESVHLKKDSLVCRICNLEFAQFRKLSVHMKNFHVQSEMPYHCHVCHYRSSFHQDVIEHFHETHYGTDKVLCHYCLKVFHIKFSNVGLGFIQNYSYHLHKHQLKCATKKCTSCCLIFLSIQELREHRIRDHISYTEQKGVKSFKSNFVVPVGEKLEEKSNKSYPASVVTSTKCEITTENPPKPLNTKVSSSNIESLNMPSYKCCECGRPMTLRHFGRFLSCGSCHYSTNCCKAFVDHMIMKHSKLKRTGKNMAMDLKPIVLKYPVNCACGYSSTDGNVIATHLVNCKKTSCHISNSTKSMITVIKQVADGFWHIDKSPKERKLPILPSKSIQNEKLLEISETKGNAKLVTESEIKEKTSNKHCTLTMKSILLNKADIQNKEKQIYPKLDNDFNIKITEVTSSALKPMTTKANQINPPAVFSNAVHNKLNTELKESNDSPSMLNALGLVRRSTSNTSDIVETPKDVSEDTKLDSLYCEVEEPNSIMNSWEEIEIVDD